MKAAAVALALLGLAAAYPRPDEKVPHHQRTASYRETPVARQIIDATRDGIKDWGMVKGYEPTDGGIKPPSRKMPGNLGWPELHGLRRTSSERKSPDPPGSPRGPRKKPVQYVWSSGKSRNWSTGCGGTCARFGNASGSGRPWKGFPAPKTAGKAAVFSMLGPHMHYLFNAFREWDNPAGRVVKWVDEKIEALQEAIGGPRRPEIYGNELKLRFINWLRRGFKALETTIPGYRAPSPAAARPRAPVSEQIRQQQRLEALGDLLRICSATNGEGEDGGGGGGGDASYGYAQEAHCRGLSELMMEAKNASPATPAPEPVPTPTREACTGGIWDEAAAKCRMYAHELPEFEHAECFGGSKPILCGGGMTAKGYLAAKKVCEGVWDNTVGTCTVWTFSRQKMLRVAG